MKPVICLDPLYPELVPEDKIERIATAGFQCVEFWGWRDKNIPALSDTFILQMFQADMNRGPGLWIGLGCSNPSRTAATEDMWDLNIFPGMILMNHCRGSNAFGRLYHRRM